MPLRTWDNIRISVAVLSVFEQRDAEQTQYIPHIFICEHLKAKPAPEYLQAFRCRIRLQAACKFAEYVFFTNIPRHLFSINILI